MREFIARTSIILSGEAGIDETANVERSLKAVFTSKTHSAEASEAMKTLKLNKELLNKLGKSLLKEALKMEVRD
jgi:gamma-glutamyl phosphate reductase